MGSSSEPLCSQRPDLGVFDTAVVVDTAVVAAYHRAVELAFRGLLLVSLCHALSKRFVFSLSIFVFFYCHYYQNV